jgi:hypothetical protein
MSSSIRQEKYISHKNIELPDLHVLICEKFDSMQEVAIP